MQIELYPHEDSSGDWVVENTDLPGEGEIHTAIFSGSDAEKLAREYYEWRVSKQESEAV